MKANIIAATACLAALLSSMTSGAAEYYVDNLKGNDLNPGDTEKPFLTIAKALNTIKGGDTIHLAPNKAPYNEGVQFKDARLSGTKEQPTIVDGHGATLSYLTHYTAEKWKDEGGGVFSTALGNNAWVMDQQGYWSGFPIVFLDGNASTFVKKREDLTEGTYLLFKKSKDPLHNTLFVKLPSGKTPADVKIEAPGHGGVSVAGPSHVTIRNMTSMYCVGDGFATCWGKGIVFENVRGCMNMDQGISNHSAESIVMNSRFDTNAGCGIVDVMMNEKSPCQVRYLNCLIENDAFRGGVEFYEGEFEMENCIVRGNPAKAITAGRAAKVNMKNCIFVNGKDVKSDGATTGDKCSMSFSHCTFYGFSTAINMSATKDTRVSVTNCAFINCATNYGVMRQYKGTVFELGTILSADRNFFNMGGVFIRDYESELKRSTDTAYDFGKFNLFVEKTGMDKKSTAERTEYADTPYSLPALRGKGENGGTIGADLKPDPIVGPVAK